MDQEHAKQAMHTSGVGGSHFNERAHRSSSLSACRVEIKSSMEDTRASGNGVFCQLTRSTSTYVTRMSAMVSVSYKREGVHTFPIRHIFSKLM
jgi:hypothetical protein